MKIGDIVRTTCFGPSGSVGDVGIIVEDSLSFGSPSRVWKVSFSTRVQGKNMPITMHIAWQGLEVISEA